MIDSERDLRGIAAALGRSEFEVAKIAYGLVSTGVIELEKPKRPSREVAAAAVNGDLGTKFGVSGYPTTFLVDRSGDVVPPHVVGPIVAAAQFSPAKLNATLQRLAS